MSKAEKTQTRKPENFTVLIIEDDEAIREMYRIKFTKSKYKTILAENGPQGIAMVQKHNPDIIMMDMMMPGINGLETLTEIRNMPEGVETDVIILTNLSKDEAPEEIDQLYPHSYIIKADHTPTQIEHYVRTIMKGKEPSFFPDDYFDQIRKLDVNYKKNKDSQA